MTFQTVPVNLVGPSYPHRSRSLSAQVTMNMIPENVPTGKTPSSLNAWPGSKPFFSGSGLDRGMHTFQGMLYKVTDTTLYGVDSSGVGTSFGLVDGTKPCVFADDGTTMRIATGSKDYQFDGTTLSEITDPDLRPGNSVAYLNQQMINDSDGGQFQTSDVGVPGSINPSNFATAEAAPDDTIRVYTFGERLYLFGDRSTVETWWNSGTGNPPFDRVNGGTMQVGLKSPYSVTSTSEFVYFLGSDNSVYRFSATQAQSITPPGIANAFESFTKTDDARAFVVNIEGQSFYILNFPTEGKTFGFNEDSGAWFQLSTGASQGNYLGTSYAEAYGKMFIGSGGNVLELDLNTLSDNGDVIIRERVLPPITSQTGNRIQMSRFQLIMETGVGLITGQGENPKVMFQASYDGGKSFSDEDWIDIGRQGEGRVKVEWYNMASAYEITVRIRVSDPVFISLHSASIDIREAGF